jgi:hypothetical protein
VTVAVRAANATCSFSSLSIVPLVFASADANAVA